LRLALHMRRQADNGEAGRQWTGRQTDIDRHRQTLTDMDTHGYTLTDDSVEREGLQKKKKERI